jgi:hypothetical protein
VEEIAQLFALGPGKEQKVDLVCELVLNDAPGKAAGVE